ncbi:MAG: hypothetical protein LYZ70_06830 [Nitrososphaerales archaeon]|nr:hypothetical protein [Nitrososphaerales archaeon]
MANPETANARLSSYATWLGGIAIIFLGLSINILSGRNGKLSNFGVLAESVTVIFLLSAILLYLTSASILASAYYEHGVKIEVGIMRARRLQLIGNVLIFWALAALMLVAFDFSIQAIFYTAIATLLPVIWLVFRSLQNIQF